MKTFAILLSIAALVGCSSMPLEERDGSPVPKSRVFAPASAGPAADAGDGTILVLRDWGFLGGGCNHTVYLDAVKVFEIAVNERIEIHAPAGHHFLRIADATLLCPGSTTSIETQLDAGQRQVYRIQLTAGEAVNLARIR